VERLDKVHHINRILAFLVQKYVQIKVGIVVCYGIVVVRDVLALFRHFKELRLKLLVLFYQRD
jgi:hypothetical protein